MAIADLRYALRGIRHSPAYSLTAVGVIALGLSLATTVFGLVDGVLFKPLQYPDAAHLVAVDVGFTVPPAESGSVTADLIDQWQERLPDVAMTAVRVDPTSGMERPNESGYGLAMIRPNLFEVLGTRPLIGGFTIGDLDIARAKDPSVLPVLISYSLWQTRFAGDPSIVGSIVRPEDPRAVPFRIAGVLPRDFTLPADRPAEVIFPARYSGRLQTVSIVARLPAGLDRTAFRARLESAMRESTIRDYRGSAPPPKPDVAMVAPLRERLGQSYARPFILLFAASALLVLIASLNVSGLMTARCLNRARDFGVRRALGARTRDIVRLVVVEQSVLFVAGAVVGIALAVPFLRLAIAVLPADMHLLKVPDVDMRVVVFAVAALALNLCLALVLPVSRTLSTGIHAVTVSSGGGAVTARTRLLGFRAVTIGQVAGTTVLVIAGGLLVASLMKVKSNATGYDIDDVIIAELSIVAPDAGASDSGEPTMARLVGFLDGVRQLPDVTVAGAADISGLLTKSLMYQLFFVPEDSAQSGAPKFDRVAAVGIPVTSGFFQAAGVRLREGRLPSDAELMSGVPVVAVSESYRRKHFGGGSALGKRLRAVRRPASAAVEIVGVVEDPRLYAWDQPASAVVFAGYGIYGGNAEPAVFVRTARNIRSMVGGVLDLAQRDRSRLRPVRVQTAATLLNDTIRARRAQSWLFGTFAIGSLTLVTVGLLGLVGMTMARRTREMGVRLTLGATRGRLVLSLVGEHLMPVLIGLGAGLLMAAWMVPLLSAHVYQISVYEPRLWGAAIIVVLAMTLLGALIPSMAASRVEPITALRTD